MARLLSLDRDALLADYLAGMSFERIAQKHEASFGAVRMRIRQHPAFVPRTYALKATCHPVTNGQRQCLTCHRVKPIQEFGRHKRSPFGIQAHCRQCLSRLRSTYSQALYRTLRDRVIAGYGGHCVSCGFSDSRALHIDHVFDDGATERRQQQRKAITLLRHIIAAHFPPRYQLLCANCNTIKAWTSGLFSRRANEGQVA